MVGASGFEPLTPSASRKCSPPELRTYEGIITHDSRISPRPFHRARRLFLGLENGLDPYWIESLNDLPGVNLGTFLAGI